MLSATPPSTFDPNAASLFVERPKWPTPVGVISIVFGGLGVLCMGAATAMVPFSVGMIDPLLGGDPRPPNIVMTPSKYALLGVGIGSALFLLVCGIMLVQRKYVARAMHLVYGAISLPIVFWSTWVQLADLEAVKAWAKQYPGNQYAQSLGQPGQDIAQAIGPLIGIVIGLAWPLFCLIWFGLVKTSRAKMLGGDGGAGSGANPTEL